MSSPTGKVVIKMREKWLKVGDANFGGSERKTKIGLREGRDGTAKDRSHLRAEGVGMFIGLKVLLSKFMCKPVKEEKESRMCFREASCSRAPCRMMRVSSAY